MNDFIEYKGDYLRTGTLLPPVKPMTMAPLSSAPGFRVYSRAEIVEAIAKKPEKRRKQFAGTDWILNQANRGSCNCAAATGALRRAMHLGGRNEVPQLSWEFLYAQLVDGDDRGSLLDHGMREIQSGGIALLDPARHPLNKHIRKRDYSPEDYASAKGYRAELCYRTDDELELATALLSPHGAGVVAVHVGRNFTSIDRKGFAGVDNGVGNHAVCVHDVDIIDGELAFDHAGSWGTNMHDDGYAYLSWSRHLSQPNQHHAFYVVFAGTNPGTDAPVAKE